MERERLLTDLTFHVISVQFSDDLFADVMLQLRRPRHPVRTSNVSLSGPRVLITPDHHTMSATFIKSVRGRWKPKTFVVRLARPQGHFLHSIGQTKFSIRQVSKLTLEQHIDTEFGTATIRMAVTVRPRQKPSDTEPQSIAAFFRANHESRISGVPKLFREAILPKLRARDSGAIHEFVDIFYDEFITVPDKLYLLVTSLHVQSWVAQNMKGTDVETALRQDMVALFVDIARTVVHEFAQRMFDGNSVKENSLRMIKWFVDIGRGPRCQTVFQAIMALFAASFEDNVRDVLCDCLLVRNKDILGIVRTEGVGIDEKYEALGELVLASDCQQHQNMRIK
jgi:hypothetical protein